jgi:hypothetical protein
VSESTTPTYRPGACNIGTRQRRQRYRLAGGALLAGVVYVAVVALSSVPAALALGAFVPFSLGVEWYLQGRRSFCAALGFAGRYEFEDDAGEVADTDARTTDRRYAFRLTVLGLFGGGGLSLVAYAVTVLV